MSSLLRDRFRARLTEAMRARDREVASALRSTLGVLDNAEAVPVVDSASGDRVESQHIAGGRTGVGYGVRYA